MFSVAFRWASYFNVLMATTLVDSFADVSTCGRRSVQHQYNDSPTAQTSPRPVCSHERMLQSIRTATIESPPLPVDYLRVSHNTNVQVP